MMINNLDGCKYNSHLQLACADASAGVGESGQFIFTIIWTGPSPTMLQSNPNLKFQFNQMAF